MTIDLDGDALHVEIVRSPQRRRTVQLRFEGGTFILRAPSDAPESWIREFLEERRGWMQKTQQKSRRQNRRKLLSGMTIQTDFFALQIEEDSALTYPKYRVSAERGGTSATFYLAPEFFADANQEKLKANLEKYLLTRMLKSGEKLLIERAQYLAGLAGIRVKNIFVRVQKSRLGYCTHDDRIMLNGKLLFASERLRDYVIYHELAHTRHKNHSKQFWAYLEKLFPGAKTADKLLRDPESYSMRIPSVQETR